MGVYLEMSPTSPETVILFVYGNTNVNFFNLVDISKWNVFLMEIFTEKDGFIFNLFL